MAGGFTVHARIESEVRFKEFGRMVEVEVNKALVEWAKIALEEVRAAETRVGTRTDAAYRDRYKTRGQHLRDSFQWAIEPVGYKGFGAAVVWSDDPNTIWQELGTRGSRRKSLKGGKGSPKRVGAVTSNVNETVGNRGVKPLYFMRKGLRRALPAGEALMAAALRNVGAFGGGSTLVDTTARGRYE